MASTGNNLVMPKLGLTMTEGVLTEWRVKPGDHVHQGEILFVVETDKIANEIEAPSNGEIHNLIVEAGETVQVGAPVLRWTGEGVTESVEDYPSERGTKTETTESSVTTIESSNNGYQSQDQHFASQRIIATPLARRHAQQQGVDLADVIGSGPRGRIKAADIKAVAESQSPRIQTATNLPLNTYTETIVPDAKHRAMVARVSASKKEVPHFYIARTVEVSSLLELRSELNSSSGHKITITHFLVKAMGQALAEHEELNRIWADNSLVQLNSYDVGVVVDTGDGLIIPVVRDVAARALDQIARTMEDVVARAREGQLQRDELEGGSISISNIGMTRTTSIVPIINPPQAAILGVGAAEDLFRPDEDGQPSLKREMHFTLACDHRVVGGMQAARFLDHLSDLIEAPHALLRTFLSPRG